MTTSEGDLAALAAALLTSVDELTNQERRLISPRLRPSPKLVSYTRGLIRAGEDPLGDAFCAIRAPERRRDLGATYTPELTVNAMIAWAAREPSKPARIVDPGAGSGRFLLAAAERIPHAQLIGVDVDPLATLLLRANATVRGFADRLSVKLIDFRKLTLPRITKPTLFVGNPPYVRHHQISAAWKEWLTVTARSFGFKASSLAGLHIHFFLKTRELSRAGDYGVYITAAEWLDVNYGSLLRKMLADGLGGRSLYLIDPKAQAFADAFTTSAITCFGIGNRPEQFTIRTVESVAELAPLRGGQSIRWEEIAASSKWSKFAKPIAAKPPGMIELGELFRVHRGTVTGNNGVWIENEKSVGIPVRYLRPSITRARELLSAGKELRSTSALKCVIDLPTDLDELEASERQVVTKFLRWAKEQGVADGYVARHRKAWWAVQFREPAPILCTYMARRAPAFVRNTAGAYHLNIAHGLYPRTSLPEASLRLVADYLRDHVDPTSGRTYAGGLVKFEPKELERIAIPPLEQLHARAAEKMDTKAVGSRRPDVGEPLST